MKELWARMHRFGFRLEVHNMSMPPSRERERWMAYGVFGEDWLHPSKIQRNPQHYAPKPTSSVWLRRFCSWRCLFGSKISKHLPPEGEVVRLEIRQTKSEWFSPMSLVAGGSQAISTEWLAAPQPWQILALWAQALGLEILSSRRCDLLHWIHIRCD